MKKKLILTLLLAGSAGTSRSMNVGQIEQLGKKLQQDLPRKIELINTAFNKLNAEDFDGLRSYLKSQISALDFEAIFELVSNNIGAMRSAVESVLNMADKAVTNAPANVQEQLRGYIALARKNLPQLEIAAANLKNVAPYLKLAEPTVEKIIANWQIVSTQNPAYSADMKDVANDMIDEVATLRTVDFTLIERAAMAAAKMASGQVLEQGDTSALLTGLPSVMDIAETVIILINNTLYALKETNEVFKKASLTPTLPANIEGPLYEVKDFIKQIVTNMENISSQVMKYITSSITGS